MRCGHIDGMVSKIEKCFTHIIINLHRGGRRGTSVCVGEGGDPGAPFVRRRRGVVRGKLARHGGDARRVEDRVDDLHDHDSSGFLFLCVRPLRTFRERRGPVRAARGCARPTGSCCREGRHDSGGVFSDDNNNKNKTCPEAVVKSRKRGDGAERFRIIL
jgi:hypothetical protein